MDAWIRIGKFGAPHGVRGELRVYPLSDVADRFTTLTEVWWQGKKHEPERLTVTDIRLGERFYLITFDEVTSREAASRLANSYLLIPKEQRGRLPEGRYFIDDILGLDVYDEHDVLIGKIHDVIQPGANDIYVISGRAKKEILIPAVKEYIRLIDLNKKRMIVRIPEGY